MKIYHYGKCTLLSVKLRSGPIYPGHLKPDALEVLKYIEEQQALYPEEKTEKIFLSYYTHGRFVSYEERRL